jgi:DEAD/DEAH box helicase domain-containing protein
MRGFVRQLLEHPGLQKMVAHHRRVAGQSARFGEPEAPLPSALAGALDAIGIPRLYAHQARALDAARRGRNVVTVTPTASGKTLVFALPVLETLLDDRSAHALFLYPTKALAQDQVAGLRALSAATGGLRPPRFEIYDGDTSEAQRRRIRAQPPEVLVTNPDMLHAGILAYHGSWASFLRNLRWVVLDELHVYRGVFGAHVHHILRRLRRLCAAAGADPRFLAASATVGNPGEFAERLVGEEFEVVENSGAPRTAREVVFLNPVTVSPYTVAMRVVVEAMRAGMRTIAFTKARRITELLHAWIAREVPDLRRRLAPYRAGYLPEERREIEARLFRGDLLAVLATSALELGIDVGGLDVCVLVGYPGSLTSTWQRIGRVGRKDRDALVVLVAMPDALDQYVLAHPEALFDPAFERAVLDPWNRIVAGQHLVCAAAEDPLREEEVTTAGARARSVVADLEGEGRLVRAGDGTRWYSFRRNPQRDINVRSAGPPYTILESKTGRLLGTVDGMRVFHECHPGAIYLHAGQSYRIRSLDTDARRVEAETVRVDYYTVVLGDKETEVIERLEEGRVAGFPTGLGRLKVTVRIREYQKKRLFGGEPISTHPLSVPPLQFETIGFWIELPGAFAPAVTARGLHFMGGLHAVEHAMIGLFPLLAIAERGDVGGISYTGHPQTGGPAIFLYDGVPGGAGLAEQGFRDLERLVERTLALLRACPCEDGCPACIHSPRCGNGNKPLDKEAARLLLTALAGETAIEPAVDGEAEAEAPEPVSSPPPKRPRRHGITRAGNLDPAQRVAPSAGMPRTLVFDLETQRGADEVGGWHNASRMGLALAVVYDIDRKQYRTYHESDVDRLLLDLAMADRVVGFNIDRFDLAVLSAYTEWDLRRIRTLDLLEEIRRRLGFRLSLGHLAETNLGESKTADGKQSLEWWKQGRIDLIESYCRKDVEVTSRLFELGRERGYLLYRDHAGRQVRVPVSW